MKDMDDKTKKICCIWLNGPDRTGKNKLARMLTAALEDRGMPVECLDEETIVSQLGSHPSDKMENAGAPLLRAAFTAHLLTRNGVTVVVAAAIENPDVQRRIRDQLPHLVDVAIHSPVIPRLTEDQGPEPNIILNIGQENPGQEELDEILARLIKFLEISNLIPVGKKEDLTAEESALIQERLKSLGYL